MRERSRTSRITERPILVGAILAFAAVVGFGIGGALGRLTAPIPSPTPTMAVSTAGPSALGSPSPSAVLLDLARIPPLRGSGDLTSPRFVAHRAWRIVWQTEGQSLTITVVGEPNLGLVLNHVSPGQGVIEALPAGTFSIDVEAIGPWAITVVED